MKKKKVKQKLAVKDKILITLFSMIIVVSVVCVAGVAVLNSRFFVNKDTAGDDGVIDKNIVTPAEIKEKYVNFLVVGVDYVEGSSRAHLTDTIMVVSFDIEGKNIDVLQIPRDSYIGNYTSSGKINAVYGKKDGGGIDGLASMIFNTFNLTIDHYVTMDMSGFVRMVDQIGGVQVNVPKQINLEGAIIKPGLQTLDGWRSEKFVRERKSYANGDLGRMDMQKIFMKALIDKVFGMRKSEIFTLAPTLMKEIKTDLTLNEMLGYYGELMKLDKSNAINFYTVPISRGAKYKTHSVVLLDKEKTAQLLNDNFRPYTKKVSADEIGILTL